MKVFLTFSLRYFNNGLCFFAWGIVKKTVLLLLQAFFISNGWAASLPMSVGHNELPGIFQAVLDEDPEAFQEEKGLLIIKLLDDNQERREQAQKRGEEEKARKIKVPARCFLPYTEKLIRMVLNEDRTAFEESVVEGALLELSRSLGRWGRAIANKKNALAKKILSEGLAHLDRTKEKLIDALLSGNYGIAFESGPEYLLELLLGNFSREFNNSKTQRVYKLLEASFPGGNRLLHYLAGVTTHQSYFARQIKIFASSFTYATQFDLRKLLFSEKNLAGLTVSEIAKENQNEEALYVLSGYNAVRKALLPDIFVTSSEYVLNRTSASAEHRARVWDEMNSLPHMREARASAYKVGAGLFAAVGLIFVTSGGVILESQANAAEGAPLPAFLLLAAGAASCVYSFVERRKSKKIDVPPKDFRILK